MSAKPVFVDYETTLTAAVANVLATTVWDALGEATTPAEALTYLNGVPETDQGATPVVRVEGQWVPLGPDEKGPHNDLLSRDAADAHPIEAITGLSTTLSGLSASIGALGSHSGLVNRDAADSHPIAAITGLESDLSAKADDIAQAASDISDLEVSLAALTSTVAVGYASVLDFGAVGDGVTDDTAAFAAAFTSLGNINAEVKVLLVPPRRLGYLVSQITVPERCALVGTVEYRTNRPTLSRTVDGTNKFTMAASWLKANGSAGTAVVQLFRRNCAVKNLFIVDDRATYQIASATDTPYYVQHGIQLGYADGSLDALQGHLISNICFYGVGRFVYGHIVTDSEMDSSWQISSKGWPRSLGGAIIDNISGTPLATEAFQFLNISERSVVSNFQINYNVISNTVASDGNTLNTDNANYVNYRSWCWKNQSVFDIGDADELVIDKGIGYGRFRGVHVRRDCWDEVLRNGETYREADNNLLACVTMIATNFDTVHCGLHCERNGHQRGMRVISGTWITNVYWPAFPSPTAIRLGGLSENAVIACTGLNLASGSLLATADTYWTTPADFGQHVPGVQLIKPQYVLQIESGAQDASAMVNGTFIARNAYADAGTGSVISMGGSILHNAAGRTVL